MNSFRSQIYWFCLALSLLGATASDSLLAATVTDPTLLEEQKIEQRKFEEDIRKRLQPPAAPSIPKIDTQIPTLLPAGKCQTISHIWLYGADRISKSKQKKLISSRIGKCLTNSDFASIANDIQENYLQAGYTTTRVGIKDPQSSLDQGNLELWVIEGRINSITLNDNSPFDQSRVDAAFPIGPGDVLNIHALDQGMEQIGRLFSQKIKMQIVPADQPGFSDIQLVEYFENDASVAADGSRYITGRERYIYSYNNGGTKDTGLGLGQVKYTRENLWGRNDSLSVSGQLSVPFHPGESENQVWQLNGSVPNGNWLFDGMLYYGKTVRIVPSIPTQFMSRSDTLTARLKANRMLFRNQQNKFEGFTKFEFSDRKNFINNTLVQTSSRKVASLNAGLMYTRYAGRSTFVLSPSITQGVPWFGAISNTSGLTTTDPHAEYLLYGLYGLYRHNFTVGSNSAISFESTFNSQYSPVGLYGEKQFVIGGEYSVRGFKENVLSDDNGWTLRNEITLPLGQWTRSLHKRKTMQPLGLKLFYDMGSTHSSDGSNLELLSGWGFGLDYQYKWVNAHVSRSIALDSSPLFSSPEGWVTNFGIRVSTIF